ncbi:MAG: hypothetical protein HFI27_03120 [Lachnospiraceae bacterium]|nr:hypothetical protein [Lachnospiraceae bacterium]
MDVQTGCGEIRPLAFPYPVFGRFAYTGYRKNQRADFAAARLNWFWVWMEEFLAWKIEGEKL